MADEQHRAPAPGHVVHLAQTFLLKPRIAHRQHLVDDQDLGLEVRGHGERQPHVHAAGVVLHGRVDELFDFGERDDLVELPFDFRPLHAEDRAVQEDVLAAGQLGMEAGADFEERSDAADDARAAARRRRDARQNLQQRRLARAVAADDADDLSRAISNDTSSSAQNSVASGGFGPRALHAVDMKRVMASRNVR